MKKVREIIIKVVKNIGAFLGGGVLGISLLAIFIKPILVATIKKDVGLGIIAVVPAVILIYVIIFGLGGGVLGLVIYNFAKFVLKLKHFKGMSVKKRIFIALTVSDDLIKEIGKWREEHQNLPVRWIEDKNFHITLIPPFYEDEIGIKKVKEKLRCFKNSVGEIELSFDKVDFDPDLKNPRLIWTTGEIPQKVIELKENLERVLGEILAPLAEAKATRGRGAQNDEGWIPACAGMTGVEILRGDHADTKAVAGRQNDSDRQFLLHITMASFKTSDFKIFFIEKLGENVLWKGKVEALVLMESKLSESGADYEILEEVRL